MALSQVESMIASWVRTEYEKAVGVPNVTKSPSRRIANPPQVNNLPHRVRFKQTTPPKHLAFRGPFISN